MKPVNGYLEILDRGFGFLRNIERNFQPSSSDTFVPAPVIHKWKLVEGIYIEGLGVHGGGKNSNLKLTQVTTINGMTPEAFRLVTPLQDQTSVNPDQRFILTRGAGDPMGKALDLITPMGKGQRGLIVSPPKSGKTTILKHLTNAMIENHPDTSVFVLLVDERPEEVTDFKRAVKAGYVLHSSADQSVAQHMRMARLAMNTAMRLTEIGRDAVVLIDSLTRMSRAFNTDTPSYGRTMTGGLGANALEIPRRFFGAARNIEKGGSLTIVATILVDTGSRMDDIIFQEFKGTGNMDLVLSRQCAEQRLWPAIHINDSGTRKEHLLLSTEENQKATEIRRALSGKDQVSALNIFLEHVMNSDS